MMNIERLAELSSEAVELEGFINKIKYLEGNEHLKIKISVSNFYDFKELDTLQTNNDKYLEAVLIEYYSKKLEEIKKEIKELVL